MSVIQELIRVEENKSISFGNYLLESKKKVLDFEVEGDLYKVKTYNEITKLEKNGILLFESVPGTAVHNFTMEDKEIQFEVESEKAASITLELEPEKNYRIYIDQVQVDRIKSNLSGKITFSILKSSDLKHVRIEKL